MNEYNLKNAAVFLQDNLNDAINFIYWQRYFMALDIIDSKIFKLPISNAKGKAPANIYKNFLFK